MVSLIGAKCGYLGGGGVVPGSGAVEEAVVWQDFTQTYRLQLTPKIMGMPNLRDGMPSRPVN